MGVAVTSFYLCARLWAKFLLQFLMYVWAGECVRFAIPTVFFITL